jgi:hypothetical protein
VYVYSVLYIYVCIVHVCIVYVCIVYICYRDLGYPSTPIFSFNQVKCRENLYWFLSVSLKAIIKLAINYLNCILNMDCSKMLYVLT